MAITFSYRIVAAVAGAAIAVGVQALASPATAATAARPGGVTAAQDVTGTAAQAAAVRYWTRARMAAALRAADGQPAAPGRAAGRPAARVSPAARQDQAEKPVSRVRQLVRQPAPARPGTWLSGNTAGQGLSWTHGGAVAAAVGKVFFTLGGADYVCSGTLVGGGHPDVVLTAAHCVTAPGGKAKAQWATNWIFVPGFHDGLMPYGEYTARRFFAIPDWTGPKGGSEQYDVAFVQVTTATRYGAPGTAKPPPGLPVEFARSQDKAPLRRAYVFGYPAEQPYSGLYLDYCAGPVTASGGSVRTPCAMTAGDSGGPWLAGFSPRPGSGEVAAVSTYKVSDDLRVLYGAVLGPQARALFNQAVSPAR
jgi:V8-like Glu-specific endopeptidase